MFHLKTRFYSEMGMLSILQIKKLFMSLSCTFYYLLDNPFLSPLYVFFSYFCTEVEIYLKKKKKLKLDKFRSLSSTIVSKSCQNIAYICLACCH